MWRPAFRVPAATHGNADGCNLLSAEHITVSMANRKNPAAVALGRRGAKARMTKLTPRQRSEIAYKAARARWAKQDIESDAERRNASGRAQG